jgi:glutaconate CoA-transferase subunit A
MPSKLMELGACVTQHVPAGSTVFVGGFGQGVPFALAREIIRSRVTGLTLCRTGADILFDLLVAAGCVRRAIVGWYGNPGIGISHVMKRASRDKSLEVTHTSNFGLLLALHAASLGVPFLPAKILGVGDTRAVHGAGMTCPFTNAPLTAVAAIRPDLAIVHAHRADEDGNIQIDGVLGDTVVGANASARVICTVERIVSRAEIRERAQTTVIPGHRVAAVALAPWGAYPSYMAGLYGRDDDAYFAFDRISRDANALQAFLDETVRRHGDHDAFVSALDRARLNALATEERA